MNDRNEAKPFLQLGVYEWPKLPAEDRMRLAYARLKSELIKPDDQEEPAIANDRLEGIKIERLDRIAAPPAYGKLLEEMSLTLKAWLDTTNSAPRTQLVVMPPCDETNIVKTWAENQGLTCLEAPTLDEMLDKSALSIPDLTGDDVLVIPNLEHWFLRHHNGLASIRLLLAAISRTKRRCLIGCNSWAWTYLTSVIDADLQLSGGVMFQAFDKVRLHSWFVELADSSESAMRSFRLSESGDDVFSIDENEEIQSDFFQKLAAHSLGIPWIAWSLWRRSLRETREIESDEENVDDTQGKVNGAEIIWIAALEEFTLPTDHRQNALLVLQSLLIHGSLSIENLRLTVPFVGQTNLVEALVRGGFIQLEHDCLSCHPAAYPAIRRELSNAGYSMDRL